MELRREPRFETTQPVRLTVLGERQTELYGNVVNLSGTGMRLIVNGAIPQGAAVKLEFEERLLLGEVCYCEPMGGDYAVGLNLEHSLVHTQELARLAARLLGQTPQPPRTAQVRKKPRIIPRANRPVTP